MGSNFTSNFIYPCVENALVDVEVLVVVKALEVVSSLVQLELLSQSHVIRTLTTFGCLVVHPYDSIRYSAIKMVASVVKSMDPTDSLSLIQPIILPFLQHNIFLGDVNVDSLKNAVKSPVSLKSFRLAILRRRNVLSSGSEISAVTVDPLKPILGQDEDVSVMPPEPPSGSSSFVTEVIMIIIICLNFLM